MSIFPTKILLATDGSEEAEMAATTAINLAKNTHSELHILTVGPGYPAYDVRIPEVAEELRRQAQEILDEQAKRSSRPEGKLRRRTSGWPNTTRASSTIPPTMSCGLPRR